ncbi:MAG: redoxin domain-containing protein [Dehalococcoidales bacterium]|nr:redoxin domain-containing protein [Dehalococcoidales bacterium]
MAELKDSCVKPVKGPIIKPSDAASPASPAIKEDKRMTARVGQEAPDFEASSFIAGKGFSPIKLSDYKGKWIVLCFYPGDFTFV